MSTIVFWEHIRMTKKTQSLEKFEVAISSQMSLKSVGSFAKLNALGTQRGKNVSGRGKKMCQGTEVKRK